jgi:type 1 glutamine amidotransferase
MRTLKTIALSLLFLLAAAPLCFAQQKPLKVVMFSGSAEYNSKDSLTAFAKLLEEKHGCACSVNVVDEKGTSLPGVDDLETADVAIFFTRRVNVTEDQLAKVKKFISSGKGVVGVRTASHGFQTWLGFDAEVLGGSYDNHYKVDARADVTIDEKGKSHPVLAGVTPFVTESKLYKNPKLADDATLLLRAATKDYTEPVAWAREAKEGVRGRIFYTSLGAPKDFETAPFQQLLVNAVLWTANKK